MRYPFCLPWLCLGAVVLSWLGPASAAAQSTEPATRVEAITAEQVEKAKDLQPYLGSKTERTINNLEEAFLGGRIKLHPFFESALSGGGFTLGAGYRQHVSSYSSVDVRGSITFSGYKRIEAEFLAPRAFDRRGVLSIVGGWREATQVGFYGIGTSNTSVDDRANYSFSQPYTSASLRLLPNRRWLVVGGGLEVSQWKQDSGSGSAPSVEEVYSPSELPGLGSSPTYVRVFGTVGVDSRPAAGYARRGGYYGVTIHDYNDTDGAFGFSEVEYSAIQHIPILRDAWVLSLRGEVDTTQTKDGQVIPFYMLPALGGGSSLRGFSSWRFRDRHSLLLSADWRVLANHFIDLALFYDAGKVTATTSDLDLTGLKSDYGVGIRLHGPIATPLRIDFAKSNEGLQIVFSAKAAF
jgi:surface antigen Omp85-like protein